MENNNVTNEIETFVKESIAELSDACEYALSSRNWKFKAYHDSISINAIDSYIGAYIDLRLDYLVDQDGNYICKSSVNMTINPASSNYQVAEYRRIQELGMELLDFLGEVNVAALSKSWVVLTKEQLEENNKREEERKALLMSYKQFIRQSFPKGSRKGKTVVNPLPAAPSFFGDSIWDTDTGSKHFEVRADYIKLLG